MSHHYETPVLLIEFDPEKPFSLLGGQDVLSGDIEFRNITSKIVLLVLS
jgi:ERCC4-type nuclease